MIITPDEIQSWETGSKRHRQVLAWARANNLDPFDVAAVEGLEIVDGRIRCHLFDRDENGRIVDDGIRVRTKPHVTPLLVPWPRERRWWRRKASAS